MNFNLGCNQVANGMLLHGNQAYNISYQDKYPTINFYEELLPLSASSKGEIVQYYSPFIDRNFRKVCYFTKNPKLQTARKAYIMSYFNDNYINFSKTRSLT